MATARLVAAFGDHRVAEEGLRRLWLYELLEAFKGYPPEMVNKGLGEVIRRCKFWPTIAEIEEGIRAGIPRPTLPVFREPVEPDLTPEEVKRRVAAVAAMKKKYGWDQKFKSQPEPAPEDSVPFTGFDVPVSDMTDGMRRLINKRNRRL